VHIKESISLNGLIHHRRGAKLAKAYARFMFKHSAQSMYIRVSYTFVTEQKIELAKPLSEEDQFKISRQIVENSLHHAAVQ
jgi:hypothetical protein